jgi:hypothetical protein
MLDDVAKRLPGQLLVWVDDFTSLSMPLIAESAMISGAGSAQKRRAAQLVNPTSGAAISEAISRSNSATIAHTARSSSPQALGAVAEVRLCPTALCSRFDDAVAARERRPTESGGRRSSS